MFGREKIATLVAEFLGTGILTLLVLSVQRSTIGVPFFVAAAAGLTVILMVFALGGISGAQLNPAVTLAMWTVRKITALTGVLYIIMQFLGAWAAYGLYHYYVKTSFQPIGGHFTGRILVAEAVGTGIFAFGLAAAVYQAYTRAVTATVYGLAYMIGIVAASSAAIGLLNPALAFGVRAFVPWGSGVGGWGTYFLGPILGAIIGANLYSLLFAVPEAVVAAPAAASSRAATTKRPAAKRAGSRKK
jgi:glycerol uptake facilitator-like aquaporin